MPIQYTGSKAGTFIRRDYTSIVNGSRASGSLIGGVMKNQTWLAFEDDGAVNFYPGPAIRLDTSGVSDFGHVLVEVPPGCTHVEFMFLAVRQEDPEVAKPAGPLFPGSIVLEVSGGDLQRITVMPSHALKTLPNIESARWYTAKLRVRANPEPVWADEWVSIKTSADFPGVWVFSAYYRTVPPAEGIPFDDML